MQQCGFCKRWFKNRKAIYAHLKHCDQYKSYRQGTNVRERDLRRR